MPVELLKDNVLLAKVYVETWKHAIDGGTEWGGVIRPHSGKFVTLEPDSYTLRYSDGREASIVVSNVELGASAAGISSRVTFLGDGQPPFS